MTRWRCGQHTRVASGHVCVRGGPRVMVRPLLTHWPLTTWALRPLTLLDSVAALLPTNDPLVVRVERADAVVSSLSGFAPPIRDRAWCCTFHGGAFVTCGVATHRTRSR